MIIQFWIQPKKRGRKYIFKCSIDSDIVISIEDAEEIITRFEEIRINNTGGESAKITRKSEVMKAMEAINVETNYDFGIVSIA